MSELKQLSQGSHPGRFGESRALSSAQRTGRSGKHLSRFLKADPETSRPYHAAARVDRSLQQRLRRERHASERILGKIKGEYERAYYGGILAERRAKDETRARNAWLPVTWPMMAFEKRCTGSRKRKQFARLETTTLCYAGTLAPG